MQNIAWLSFLRHLPQSLQDGLAIKTLGGTEIAIQTILRLDHEFFALKGRLAGTQDAGRVFFIPYDQIDHLFYHKEIRESDFSAGFDSLQMPSPGAEAVIPSSLHTSNVEPTAAEPVPDSVTVNRPTPVPLKSAVLERFRTRSGSSSPGVNLRPSQG